MDSTFLAEKITRTKATITLYEDAIDALIGANAVQSYTLDTGQTRQSVTKADINGLQATLNSLYNRLAVFQQRLNGTSTFIARGSW